MRIDATGIEAFQTCRLKYFTRHIQGWTPRNISPALGFGGAMHLGLAEWYRHPELPVEQRFEAAAERIVAGWPQGMPADDWRTLDKALRTMRDYAAEYPHEVFQIVQGATGPMIEIPFCLPIGAWLDCANSYVELVPVTGMPTYHPRNECPGTPDEEGKCKVCSLPCEIIEYGGILDGFITHNTTSLTLEHKNTSVLGPSYFRQFTPNHQVTGYHWGGHRLSGQALEGVFINALGVKKSGSTEFARRPIMRSQPEIDRWKTTVIATCNEIARCKRTGVWPDSPRACTIYGGCELHEVHELPMQEDWQRVLESKYKIEHWDFMAEHR